VALAKVLKTHLLFVNVAEEGKVVSIDFYGDDLKISFGNWLVDPIWS
jgi:hypothetical protein